MSDLSALERLGLEVAAQRLLGQRHLAVGLMALIDAEGRRVGLSGLAAASSSREVLSPESARVRVCRIRGALADVGVAGAIQTARGGYTLPEPGRSEVLAALREHASLCVPRRIAA